MVRATYAGVIILWGGASNLPPDWTEAAITSLCTTMDAILDGKASPSTLGTGTNEAAFANECVRQFIDTQNENSQNQTNRDWWTKNLQDWLQSLLSSTTHDAVTSIKMQDTS